MNAPSRQPDTCRNSRQRCGVGWSLAADLAAADRFAILCAWLAEDDRKAEFPRPPGIQLRARRYLSFKEIRSVGQLDAGAARELVDSYLERGIVRRGLVLKCRSCMNTDWYPLDDVGHDFKCERCRSLSLVARASWVTNTDEPTPYYDLAEVVFQALKVNCHVPIGGSAMLEKASRAFAEAPELKFRIDADTKVELDLLVIADGKIGLGEAKKGTKLDATAKGENQWLRNLKQLCPRRPCRLRGLRHGFRRLGNNDQGAHHQRIHPRQITRGPVPVELRRLAVTPRRSACRSTDCVHSMPDWSRRPARTRRPLMQCSYRPTPSDQSISIPREHDGAGTHVGLPDPPTGTESDRSRSAWSTSCWRRVLPECLLGAP